MTKILIVDDTVTLRNELKYVLLDNQYEVIEAGDGEEAFQLLQDEKNINLMVLDVNMPKMDGMTLIEKIHSDEQMSKIPIIMLTTEAKPELKEKAKLLGVKAWVTKPFIPEKFILGISKILNKESKK